MQMQQDDPNNAAAAIGGGASNDHLDIEGDDTQAEQDRNEAFTRLSDYAQLENFLTYGKWDLNEADIERIKKDEEMKQRVSAD